MTLDRAPFFSYQTREIIWNKRVMKLRTLIAEKEREKEMSKNKFILRNKFKKKIEELGN